jgi:hypothetical protein
MTTLTLIRGASIVVNAAYREVLALLTADPSVSFASAALAVASVHQQAGTGYGAAVANAALILADNGQPTDVIILAN